MMRQEYATRKEVASPPDAEVNIPPVENAKGIIVIDGCIPIKEIGKLKPTNQ